MRVPLSWLREYVDVSAESTPDDVLAALVSVGFEEEDVHRFELSGPIVVGEVLEFVEEPQKNGKTIRWCQVDVGDGVLDQPVQVGVEGVGAISHRCPPLRGTAPAGRAAARSLVTRGS